MNMKKGKLSPVKEILFTYLAISKILYWFNTIVAMNYSDLENVGQAVIMRLLNQDLLLIIGVAACYFLNERIEARKSKHSNILGYALFYAIGYVVLIGIAFFYNLILLLIFAAQYFDLNAFVRGFISFMPSFTLGYLAVATALEIKLYFKKKNESSGDAPSVPSTEEKLAMLKVLLDDGILTQEEFDRKKKLLHA